MLVGLLGMFCVGGRKISSGPDKISERVSNIICVGEAVINRGMVIQPSARVTQAAFIVS